MHAHLRSLRLVDHQSIGQKEVRAVQDFIITLIASAALLHELAGIINAMTKFVKVRRH